MVAANQRKRVAPYAPKSAVSEFFDHIRYVRTPGKIDSSLLQDYGISASQAFPLLSTLRFLGVIESDGTPTPAFRGLQTGGDEFQSALREIVQRAYSDLFSRLDVSRDSRDKIKNFFSRNYSPATAERATALFLDLCGEAGISAAAADQPRQAPSAPARTTGARGYRPPPPPSAPPPDSGRVVLDVRLTEDDLSVMDAADIEAVFTAAGKIQMARTKAHAQRNREQSTTKEDDGE
jgi:hypothetical protein